MYSRGHFEKRKAKNTHSITLPAYKTNNIYLWFSSCDLFSFHVFADNGLSCNNKKQKIKAVFHHGRFARGGQPTMQVTCVYLSRAYMHAKKS
jgi:hypothetical protein